jgi:hypothetical protein
MKRWYLTFFWFLLLVACKNGPYQYTEQNPRIKEALERRRLQYAADIMANCRREAVRKADDFVDSLISAEIQIRISDSILFPEKPARPTFPGAITLNDTLHAKPLLPRR